MVITYKIVESCIVESSEPPEIDDEPGKPDRCRVTPRKPLPRERFRSACFVDSPVFHTNNCTLATMSVTGPAMGMVAAIINR